MQAHQILWHFLFKVITGFLVRTNYRRFNLFGRFWLYESFHGRSYNIVYERAYRNFLQSVHIPSRSLFWREILLGEIFLSRMNIKQFCASNNNIFYCLSKSNRIQNEWMEIYIWWNILIVLTCILIRDLYFLRSVP